MTIKSQKRKTQLVGNLNQRFKYLFLSQKILAKILLCCKVNSLDFFLASFVFNSSNACSYFILSLYFYAGCMNTF